MSTICYKDYSIVVNAGDCPDWLTMVWTGTPGNPPPENVVVNTGTITRTFIGGQFQLQVANETVYAYYADALGTMPYAGAGCNCNCHLSVDLPASGDAAAAGFQILQDAVVILDVDWTSFPVGLTVVDLPFTIAPSAGCNIYIRGRWHPAAPAPYFWTYVSLQSGFNTYQAAITNV